MMLSVENILLDFNEDIEMERICRLFEKLDAAAGDFSYQFQIPFTSNNAKALTIPFTDVSSKKVYKNINADLMDNDGEILYRGFIRVEDIDYDNRFYKCSFFSGNSNWISKLTGQVSDADFSQYDVDIKLANIQASWSNTSGVIFPFFDSGNLVSRSNQRTVEEDWSPCIFAKDVIRKIFNSHSIKLQGELLDDWTYNNLLICANTHNETEVEDRTIFANKTAIQNLPSTTLTLIKFEDVTHYPYYNSPKVNYSTVDYSYTADIKCKLKIDLHFEIVFGIYTFQLVLYKNGANVFATDNINNSKGTIRDFTLYVDVVPGDKIQIYGFENITGGLVQLVNGTLKVSPVFIYGVLGNNIVPKWSQQQFVTNILSLFNVVTDFDQYSKTLTINLFDKLSSKKSNKLPDTLRVTNSDYVEFIDNYGVNNNFVYQESSDDEVKKYNVGNFIKYGGGTIKVDNQFLKPSVDFLESDFTSPTSYLNRQFGNISLERTTIFTYENGDSPSITSVSNNSGIARFNVDSDVITVGQIAKIEMDNIHYYDGEWVVTSVGSGYFEVSEVVYLGNDTGKATIQVVKTTSDDNVYIFLNTGLRTYIDISTYNNIYIGSTSVSSVGYSYFNLLDIKKQINTIFTQGLSFGKINNTLSYQRTLLDTFWNSLKRILNDPAKVYMAGTMSKEEFKSITPLEPVEIETEETSNKYYVNKITSYKNSYTECVLELIKL